jgi:hypothetical protein
MLQALLAFWLIAPPSAPFVFQNHFWVNLHQHLHAAAMAGRAVPDAYTALAKRDERFDGMLVATNDALGRMSGEAESVTDEAIDPAVRAALNEAALAYRRDVWPRQRQINDAWIADMKTRVARHGTALIAALAHGYHTDWP